MAHCYQVPHANLIFHCVVQQQRHDCGNTPIGSPAIRVDVEHIVVDGASMDGTTALVRRMRHVAAFVCEPDLGIYDAMNKGLGLATGDIVGFLNADDVYQAIRN